MKTLIKQIFALHASVAYLGMLTGFGAVLFTYLFFYLLVNGSEIRFLSDCGLCRWGLTYLTLVIGPGALAMAGYFYTRMRRVRINH